MVSQAPNTREVTFQDIPKQEMFYDLCGCLCRKTGAVTGIVLNLCIGCKNNAVIAGTKPVGKDRSFVSIDRVRVVPGDAGPVRPASPQPTEHQVEPHQFRFAGRLFEYRSGRAVEVCDEAEEKLAIYEVVRTRSGIQKIIDRFLCQDDAFDERDRLGEMDESYVYSVVGQLVRT